MLNIKDLSASKELDRTAMATVSGGNLPSIVVVDAFKEEKFELRSHALGQYTYQDNISIGNFGNTMQSNNFCLI